MIIGIDAGGSSVRIARFPDGSSEAADEVIVLRTPADVSSVPAAIGDAVASLGSPAAIGVGCAGVVDRERGMWKWMPHAEARGISVVAPIESRFGVPVAFDNDANMAVLAEATNGAGSGERFVLMVLLGTGIGGGLTIDGVVERGRGALGEIGHMKLAVEPRCACGSSGCWEALVSGRVLDAAARDLVGPAAMANDLYAASEHGDQKAQAAVARIGSWFAVGIENLVMALDPDVVVIGGGAVEGSDVLLEAARSTLAASVGVIEHTGPPPIRRARHRTLAGLVGAAIAAEEMTR
jgi:glucokinase